MQNISGSQYTASGSDLNNIANAMVGLYGATAVFGLGGSGKTELAESIVSIYFENTVSKSHTVSAHDSVISSALKSWFNSSFFSAAIGSFLLEADAEKWAQDLITGVGLPSYESVCSLAAITDPGIASSVKRRLELLQIDKDGDTVAAVSPTAKGLLPIYKFSDEGEDYLGTFIRAPHSKLTDLVFGLNVKGIDKGSAKVFKSSDLEMERADSDNFLDLLEDLMEKLSFASTSSKDGVTSEKYIHGEWFCAVLRSSFYYVDDSALKHSLFEADNDIELCITQLGLQYRIPDDLDRYESHKDYAFDSNMIKQIAKVLAEDSDSSLQVPADSSVKGSTLSAYYADLFKEEPLVLLTLLSQTDAVYLSVNMTDDRLSAAYNLLVDLVRQLDLIEKPTLVMTEMKAVHAYGAVAYNKHLEQKGVELQLKRNTAGGVETISYTADCSLVVAALGSLMLSPVTHISVLDATLSSENVFNSTTQKGGLDSTGLYRTQFLSNIATLAKGYFVIETRDDFTTSNDESEANDRARSTLGANSRIAVQIMGSGSTPRSIWCRIKGGDTVSDAWIDILSVRFSDYPRNILRPVENARPSFLDRVEAASGNDVLNSKSQNSNSY